jgi:hypothetical protein
MHGIMNQYIWYDAIRDIYVERCESDPKCMGNGFALSSPYFDFSSLDEMVKSAACHEVDNWIKA